jgi:hypothetical protein
MAITIEPLKSRQDELAVQHIRSQVFEIEMGIALPRIDLAPGGRALHLLARVGRDADPAGVLSIVDTTGEAELLSTYGVHLGAGAKLARYTQLAVLRAYRGMSIPIMMMLEAHRRFVEPERFSHTWLLFDAERASSSFLCRRLSFTPMDPIVLSEYGKTRALVREEDEPYSKQALIDARHYVEESIKSFGRQEGHATLDLATHRAGNVQTRVSTSPIVAI